MDAAGLLYNVGDLRSAAGDDLRGLVWEERDGLEVVDADLDHDDIRLERRDVDAEPPSHLYGCLRADAPVGELEARQVLGRGPVGGARVAKEHHDVLARVG